MSGYSKETFELLRKLNIENKYTWEIPVEINEKIYPVQFRATESEVLSAMLSLNRNLQDYEAVMLENFLYELDVHPEDIRRCYADSVGWALQCYDCWCTSWIEHDISHEMRDGNLVLILTFDPKPVTCLYGCVLEEL